MTKIGFSMLNFRFCLYVIEIPVWEMVKCQVKMSNSGTHNNIHTELQEDTVFMQKGIT